MTFLLYKISCLYSSIKTAQERRAIGSYKLSVAYVGLMNLTLNLTPALPLEYKNHQGNKSRTKMKYWGNFTKVNNSTSGK